MNNSIFTQSSFAFFVCQNQSGGRMHSVKLSGERADTSTLESKRQHQRRGLADALKRAYQQDRQGLEEVFRLTSPKLLGICVAMLGSRMDAEDVLQDIYIGIWNRAASFDPARGTAMTWLIAIARNRCIDRIRRSRPVHAPPCLDIPSDATSAFDILEEAERDGEIAAALLSLKPEERQNLQEAFFGGITYPMLAKSRNVSVGTMKSRMRRTLLKVRGALEQRNEPPVRSVG